MPVQPVSDLVIYLNHNILGQTNGCLMLVQTFIQQMKSIAAVALIGVLTREEVTAAGVSMGLILVPLAITGAIDLVNSIVPICVVSGMQLGIGMGLAIHGLTIVAGLTWIGDVDCILLALLAAFVCLILLRETRQEPTNPDESNNATSLRSVWRNPPMGIFLFFIAKILASVKLGTGQVTGTNDPENRGILSWVMRGISWNEWKTGLLQGALPQLPLTTLNSVISVCCLASSLYP